jgi:hypothetical protein
MLEKGLADAYYVTTAIGAPSDLTEGSDRVLSTRGPYEVQPGYADRMRQYPTNRRHSTPAAQSLTVSNHNSFNSPNAAPISWLITPLPKSSLRTS